MAIRMTHPQHGVHFAVGAEVEWNKLHGWKVEAAPAPAPEPLATDARTRYIEKFGRAPHHRMGEASILREIAEG